MKKISCYLIGKDNLLIESGKILLAHGHSILGVCSSSLLVKEWSHENNIRFTHDLCVFESTVETEQAEYLFSIINDQVLNDKIITSPLHFSINYHDSLLPKYAGVHATSWAILNGEKQHGITWHIMEKGIDKGNILIQDIIDIDPEDTAFTLNLKCYSSAISSFTHLISLLSNEAYCVTPQNMQQRSYYGLYQKPDNFGWIDWNKDAEEIRNLIQALDFGKYQNSLTTAKFLIGSHNFIVSKIKVLAGASKLLPGTIVEFDQKSITIATLTQDIRISELLDNMGQPINLPVCLQENHMEVGSLLKAFLPHWTEKNRKILEKTSKSEKFWISKWVKTEDTTIPFLPIKKYNAQLIAVCSVKLKEFNKKISEIVVLNSEFFLGTLSLLLIYLSRINNKHAVSVLWSTKSLLDIAHEYAGMLSPLVPLTPLFPDDINFLDAARIVHGKIVQLNEHVTFFNDLHARFPEIKEVTIPHIAIVISNSIKPYQNSAPLVFQISNDGNNVDIFIQSELLTREVQFILKNIPDQIEVMAKSILSNIKQNIYTLPIITKKEKKHLIYNWNNTHTKYPKRKNIQQLFEKQVALYSNNPAVVMGDSLLTYAELNEVSNQFMHFYRELNVQPGQVVCVILERSIELVISILATVKCGGIYVPIDPDHPDERIIHIIKECQPKLCISHSKFEKRLSAYIRTPTSLVLVDKNHTKISQHKRSNLVSKMHGDDIANIMYTSGSTGKPKGIQIVHRGIIRLVKNTNFVGVKESDCVACIANPMFDASTFEIWSALLNGAKLVIITKEVINSLDLFHREIEKNGVTILLLTSAFFDFIVTTAPVILNKIDTLVVVGDVLNSLNVQKIFQLNPHPRRIINGYGPTENTGATTSYEVNSLSDLSHGVPIGKPVSNTTVYVCDQNNQLLSIGAVGELLTGGDGLAKGYVNKPYLTQERFIKNPFENSESLLYKTGDLVRWLPDGNLEYMGRSDNLVKIRGFRIELTEIEHILLTYPGVKNCYVAVNKTSGKNKQIVAWIISKDNTILASSEIKLFLSSKLPDYMIPSTYVFVEKFPLTLNGKIDKDKLFQLLLTKTDENNETILPANEQQLSLIKIWHHIFKQKSISIYDNFFELGGDSIVAMQIQFAARQMGIELTVKDIFTYQTIEKLALQIDYLDDTRDTVERRNQIIPLSPIQSWFFDCNFLKKEQFSQYCIVEIKSNLESFEIENHIKKIITENDCFCLRYSENQTKWTQHYSTKNTEFFELLHIDIIDVISSEHNMLLRDIAQDMQAKFDLNTGPLFLGAIVRTLSDNKSYLLLVAHHLIFDGVSWRIFLTALDTACSGYISKFNENKGFVDWCLSLSHIANKIEWQYEYYTDICSKKISFKYDHEAGSNTEASTRYVEQCLTRKETQILHQISQQYQIRLDELLIAVCVQVLSEWQNLEGVCIDIERHGRECIDSSVDPSSTMGWFTSLFPMYFIYRSEIPLKERLFNIREQFKSIKNNGIDFGVLKYLLRQSRLKSEITVSFNYWGQLDSFFDDHSNFKFKELNLISHPDNMRTHQLNIEALILQEQLKIRWIYSNNFYKQSTIESLCENTFTQLRLLISLMKNQEDHLYFAERDFPKPTQAVTNFVEPIKDSYPLSPIQSGLLFHTVNTPGCEAYAVQLIWELTHNLNLSLLRKSMYFLLQRHPILRVYFEWKDQSQPIQYVQHIIELPWHEYDWTNSQSIQQEERFELFLKTDRQTNFSLSRPPLMRISVIKLMDNDYKVVLSMHHILLDGWSMSVLLGELNQIYFACLNSKPIALLQPPLFFDYIWRLQNQNTGLAKKKWKKYLKGFYTTTDLPIKKHIVSNLINYQEKNLSFNKQISTRIASFCQNYQITLSTLLQAAWALLLSRYSGQQDIIFGITVSVRPPEINNIDNMIGLAINTIPLRVKINEQQIIVNYLRKVQEIFIEISEYATSSLTDIHVWSQIEKGSHLFDTILVVENYPYTITNTEDITFKHPKIIDPTHYSLSLTAKMDPINENLSIRFAYDLNQVDCDRLHTLIEHFQIVILKILEKPLHELLEIDIMSASEKNMILYEWNNTDSDYQENEIFSQLFENQAAKTPLQIAVSCDNEKLTYQELNLLSNQMAHYLRDKGVKTNTPVALCVERGLNVVISILGIIKAGGFYIPIDPEYPKDRIQHMLRDSCALFIITESHIQTYISSFNPKAMTVVILDQELQFIQKQISSNLLPTSKPDDLIYTIYTSGTTGKPKGVMIKHRAMNNFLYAMQTILQLSVEDKWLAITPISFDISGLELFLPLIIGAQCVIANKHIIVDGKKLGHQLSTQGISILQATPMTWNMLLEAGWVNTNKIKVLCGGEPLKMKLCERLLEQTNKILNLYGPTETTIWSSYFEYKRGDVLFPIAPIGRPISNTKFYVLDKHLKLVPIGMIGELYIGGDGLAAGYFNQLELTKEKFIPNPFTAETSSQLYKTGDLVSWRSDGSLEYIGRIDEQIKIRGHRVELGEIQNQIETHPEVQQGIVLLDKNGNQESQIIACIIWSKRQREKENDLRNYLKNFLPPHMIPKHFIVFNKFPLTPNKKVDKIRLLHLAKKKLVAMHDIDEEIDPPTTEEEKNLSNIWSRVLMIPAKKINRNDNFFDLGGHSLNALHVLSEIHQVFNLDLEIRVLFDFPTLSLLANKIFIDLQDRKQFSTPNVLKKENTLYSCLVPLKTSGKKRPLFLIHPVGGTVFWYIHLAKFFDVNRPVYGIQDPGINASVIPFHSIPELAEFYIKIIRKVQPEGPYLLGGASAGSNISVEIAAQLKQINQEVGFVGLLDGWAYYPTNLEDKELFENLMMRQYYIMEQQFIDYGITLPEKLLQLQWHRSKSNHNYIPPCLDLQLTLFKAKEILPIFETIDSRSNHWENYSTFPIHIEIVAGDHETMFNESNAKFLSQKISELINKIGL